MTQVANIELVENLKPFIMLFVQQYLEAYGGGSGVYAGNNIVISGTGEISLAPSVEVEEVLRIGKNAVIQMWDDESELYRTIRITNVNGQHYLEFVGTVTEEEIGDDEAESQDAYNGFSGGNNIDVADNGVISLTKTVEIKEVLRIGKNAIFEMWDDESEMNRGIRVEVKGGQHYLTFSQSSDWEGLEE